MHEVDRDRPLQRLETMAALVSDSVTRRRFVLFVSLGFASLALLSAAFGTYGVVSCGTRQREREFGIRLALGATPGAMRRLALGQALVPVPVRALAHITTSQLFGVSPAHPLALGPRRWA